MYQSVKAINKTKPQSATSSMWQVIKALQLANLGVEPHFTPYSFGRLHERYDQTLRQREYYYKAIEG